MYKTSDILRSLVHFYIASRCPVSNGQKPLDILYEESELLAIQPVFSLLKTRGSTIYKGIIYDKLDRVVNK